MTLHHFKNILKPLLITIFLLALYKLGSHITPLYFFNSETASMPLFHLGLSPAIIGFIFIEVLFMTPIFKKIKKKGEKRHSLKNKLSLGLSFLLATISACFLTRTIEHVRTASGDLIISDPNLVTFIFLTACYVLGFGLILLIGHLITRFGLMNGYCALFLFNHLIVLKNNTLQYYKDLVVKNLSPNFFGIALFIFISWFLYKSFTKTTHVFYKKSISLKMPFFIQGIIPFILSGSSGFILLSFLQESFNFNISLNLPRYGSWEYCGYTVLLTFTMGILLSLFLIRPKKIAHSLNKG